MTLRVTIIDDHTLFREGLQSLLERHGLEVLDSAGDGPGGIAALQESRPDVVLLDLRMPRMGGQAVLRRIREMFEDLPVVMLTTSDADRDLVEALKSGANGYLLKDMEPDAVVAALRSIVAGEMVVAPALTPALARVVQGQDAKPSPKEGIFRELTPREREILGLLAEGLSNRSIGEQLGISEGTVKAHVKAILRKLQIRSRVAAAVLAVEHGLGGISGTEGTSEKE